MTDSDKKTFAILSERRAKLADALEDPCLRGVKTSIVDKYSDQAHFVYELIQNADDALATEAAFDVHKDRLVFTHNGKRHFTVTNPATEGKDYDNGRIGDINAITGIGLSSKPDSNKKGNAIGKFGVGFKSIFQYTNTPEIYDCHVSFKIIRQIVPILQNQDYPGRKSGETVFVFPFDNSMTKNPAKDSLEKLKSLLFPTLFLNNLQVITFNCGGCIGEYSKHIIKKQRYKQGNKITLCELIEYTRTIQTEIKKQKMFLFSRIDEKKHRFSVGFMLGNDGRLIPVDYKAFCFFPTKHETKLKFLIHAPFLLTDSREAIKEFDEHNIDMIDKLSTLASDSLMYMRDMRTKVGERLIDDSVLTFIPTGIWGDSDFFKPFWTKTSICFKTNRILPTIDSYTERSCAFWPSTKQLPNIFSDATLQALYNRSNIQWVFRNKWNDTDLENALSQFIKGCISECPSEMQLLDLITCTFIERQSIEWLSTFYKWLDESENRRNKARKLPIFLNKSGKAVAAFNQGGQHILFLPVAGADNYETVNEILLKDRNAKELIDRYKLAQPSKDDLIRFIINEKLSTVPDTEVDKYFKQVFEYYVSLPQDGKKDLLDQMRDKVCIKSSTLNNRDKAYREPKNIYMPQEFIKEYFHGMNDVFFVDAAHYHTQIESRLWSDFENLLRQQGVASEPRLKSREMEIDGRLLLGKYFHFSQPAEKYWLDQNYIEQYIEGAASCLQRIIEETDQTIKKNLSLLFWRTIRFHASQYSYYPSLLGHYVDSFVGQCQKNFLSGVHVYSFRGERCEGFDSPQLFALRKKKWIIMSDGSCDSPCEIPISRLPSEYEHGPNDAHLITTLQFRKEETLETAQAKAQAEAAARENLSEEQKRNLDIGEKVSQLGLTPEDLEEAARIKKERIHPQEQTIGIASNDKEENLQAQTEHTEAEQVKDENTATFHSPTQAGMDETKQAGNGQSANTHVQSKANSNDDCDVPKNSNEIGAEQRRPVSENEKQLPRDKHKIIDKIAKDVDTLSSSFKKNIPPPPLPNLSDGEDDNDELTPRSVNFEERILRKTQKQAREIAELEHGDELQQKAKNAERYTQCWFKTLLDLELLGREEDNSEQQEISLSFTKIEKESGTDRTFVLQRPSRNIPQWLEDLSGIPLDMYVGEKKIRPVIEVMSVRSFNLRVKFKADNVLNGLDLTQLKEAKITAVRPSFLLESLKEGLNSLPFKENKNLRDDLTRNIEFIFGPPGTGKTTFLAKNRIIPLMQRHEDYRVLVLAPTNKAADVQTDRILSTFGKDKSYKKWLIRFGSTLDDNLEMEGICPGKDVDLKKHPRHVLISTIARFPYDFCITGNSTPQKLVDWEWDYIIIDEASMISLVCIIYPLYKKTHARFIIAGDPFQIEPIISCEMWKDENIYTMLGLCNFVNPVTTPHKYQITKQTKQYRSIPAIGRIFSQYRYGGILEHARSQFDIRRLNFKGMPEIRPLTLLKFPVSSYESVYKLKRQGLNGGSAYHIYSALFAFEFANAVVRKITNNEDLFRIGVISPYRAQADIIQKLIESMNFPDNIAVSSGTIHGFQGDECEMVIVLFNPPPGISGKKGSFINKKNIINVAVSRAKDYLIVMMPDDQTPNLENMLEVRKIERLMRNDAANCIIHETPDVEDILFGDRTFIENNAFSTGHQSVNVYGAPEMRYEIRSEESAVDVQIKHDAVKKNMKQ